MELVYLWVEDYKNIHKQGFNFSPRFTCKYDKEKNELTIDENDNYIENFFGENINVTAIVGKNGSGKSSILKIVEETKYYKNINYILLYKLEENFYCEHNHKLPNVIGDIKVELIERDNSFNKRTFNPKILRVSHNEKVGKNSLSHYYFGEYNGLYGGRDIKRYNFYNMLEARFFVPRYVHIALERFEIFKALKKIYKFDTLRLILKNNSTKYVRKYIEDEISLFRDKDCMQSNLNGKFCIYEKNEPILCSIKEEMGGLIEEAKINLYDRNREKLVSVLETIENIHRKQTYGNQVEKFNKYQEFDLALLIAFIEYYLKNTDPCEPSIIVYNMLIELEEEIKEKAMVHDHFFRITKSYILSFMQKLEEKNLGFIEDNSLSVRAVIEAIKYIQKFKTNYFDIEGSPYIDIPIDTNLKENLKHIKILQKIFSDYEFDCGKERYLRVFEYDLINNQIGSTYETISDGEKHFVRFVIDVIYYLQTLKRWNFNSKRESLAIFLVDEPDNALHPAWKKRMILSAIVIFKNYLDIQNITVHLIFTTHSPFLLSDIPKQNIIFLDKDKNGKCKVVDGLKEKKQTFGANIHTLLSDSFFMEDGLMGEFAKGKIDEVIKLLNRDSLDKKELKYCQQIISIIGEPIVKNQLQRVLDSKRLKKVDEIDAIKKSIKEMQKRLDELEK